MNCGNCGAQVSANDRFCPECGTPVQVQQMATIKKERFCPECGTEIFESDAFCPNCGKSMHSAIPDYNVAPAHTPLTPKKSQTGMIILIISLVLVIAVGAAIIAYKIYDGNSDSDTENDDEPKQTQMADDAEPTEAPTPKPTEIPEPPEFTGVQASSTRSYDVDSTNGETVYYYPSYVMDGEMNTAWTPDRKIDSYEPSITITADEDQYVTGIRMTNGYCKSEKTYTKNKRITKARISYNGGEKEVTFSTDNYRNMIEIEFDEPVYTDYITVTVLETVDGGWHDVAISEINAY